MMKKKLITSTIMSGLLISGLANASYSQDIKFAGKIINSAPEWEVSLAEGLEGKINNITIDMSDFSKSGDTLRYTLFDSVDELTILKAVMKSAAKKGQPQLAPKVSFQDNQGQDMELDAYCFEGLQGCSNKLTINATNIQTQEQIGVLEITVNGEYAVLSKTGVNPLLHTNRGSQNYALTWLLNMPYAPNYQVTQNHDSNYDWFNELLDGLYPDQQNIAAAMGVGFQKVEFIAEDKAESPSLQTGTWEATTNVSVTWQ
ncbi:hypothetical protein C9980_18380 [Vibrio mediterranei]|uniref:F4 family fimbrial subunit n=1 Tax=Vibrio TaxID=662 RepID=UPI0007BC3E47|nr:MULTISPECIES: hypothetical protein [Vibrio]OIN26565.1 hypothetical protein AWH66_2024090 [Vibrio barjaei]PTC03336.1 hypothetical protein C9980_18380 [Vibrio mediterranei]